MRRLSHIDDRQCVTYSIVMAQYYEDSPMIQLLSALEHGAASMDNLLDEMRLMHSPMTGGVSLETYKKIKRRQSERHKKVEDDLVHVRARHRFSVLLSRLTQQGLIQRDSTKSTGIIALTRRGKEWLIDILRVIRKQKNHPRLPTKYQIKKSKNQTVIIFDISEKERWKRSWLRSVLKNLKFKMIQKSVWIGNTILPTTFLDDLSTANLLSCVHIFSVVRHGTMDVAKD